MLEMLLKSLLNSMTGNKMRRSKRPRGVSCGDVVCVEGDFLKRYGIWTGKNFVVYGKDRWGRSVVHEEGFREFLEGAENFAICEFPEKYGRPTLWEQPVSFSSVVMPQDKIWKIMDDARKMKKYKVYSPEETVIMAKSKLGESSYLTSEHFAMWCKTGISESHELELIRNFWDRMIVY